jgi:exonuclease VII small subunit
LAFENGVLAFENGVLALENGVLALEKGVNLAFEKAGVFGGQTESTLLT